MKKIVLVVSLFCMISCTGLVETEASLSSNSMSSEVNNSSESSSSMTEGISSALEVSGCVYDTTASVYCKAGETYKVSEAGLEFVLPNNLFSVNATVKNSGSSSHTLVFGWEKEIAFLKILKVNKESNTFLGLYPEAERTQKVLGDREFYVNLVESSMANRYSYGFFLNDSTLLDVLHNDLEKKGESVPMLEELLKGIHVLE
jgi:hypothetical protein